AGRRRRSAAPCATVSGSTAARAGAARGAVARRPAPVARGTAALRCAARPRAARPRWSARLRATSQETRRTERHERTPCETDGEGAGHRTGYTITPTGEGGCLPLRPGTENGREEAMRGAVLRCHVRGAYVAPS